MLVFFIVVGLGIYVTVCLGEPVSTTMDYTKILILVAFLGYFVKAMGENISRIVFPVITKKSRDQDENGDNAGSEEDIFL